MKTGKVYIWISDISCIDFEPFTEIRYDKNDDIVPSKFMRDAGIVQYDQDFAEFEINDELVLADQSFEGHSYYDTFKDELLERLRSMNIESIKAQLLIYDSDNIVSFSKADPPLKKCKLIGVFEFSI